MLSGVEVQDVLEEGTTQGGVVVFQQIPGVARLLGTVQLVGTQ